MKKYFSAFIAIAICTVFSFKSNAQKATNNSASNEFENVTAFGINKISNAVSRTVTGSSIMHLKAMRD